MPRLIKFRAWDEFFNKFVNSDQCEDGMEGFWRMVRHGREAGRKVEVMQFTGLLDKNGKEIYEGDVIKLHNILSVHEILQVVFDRGCFALSTKVVPELQEAVCFREAFHQAEGKSFRMEIIGNIYENPELLK